MLIIPTYERVFTLRKSFEENGKIIAFGYDVLNGVFFQVFDANETSNIPVVSYDQSLVLTGMRFSSPISKNAVREILAADYPNTFKEFTRFLKEKLPSLRYGHATDEEGRYEKKVEIVTYGDWVKFFETVETHFVVTDICDFLILKR